MSYTVGTDAGRVREIVGDTDEENELFPDAYYTDLLTRYSISGSAIAALRRILASPYDLLKKYSGFGPVTISDLAALKRSVLDEIKALEESMLVEASSTDSCTPDESETAVGEATDDDGWYETSDIDDWLSS